MSRHERNLLAPEAYQTYAIAQPADTLVRAACEQVGCAAWQFGWETVLDESTEQGQRQAAYVRLKAGRSFREMKTDTGLTVFRFEAHQRCFAEHQTRPQIFAVRDGDYRGNPTGRHRTHTRPADWVEDFGENQLRLADQQQKG